MTWLFVPGTCSHSAPASADSISESELPSPERVASLTWRGNPLQLPLWSRRWKRGGFIRLLSGLTQEHSTLDRGVAEFIASLPETHASRTATPESGADPMTIDGLSTSFSGSSTSAGLIVSSERTCRGTSRGNSRHWYRHWKEWDIALRAESSARPKSARLTEESAFSLWPTARAEDSESSGRRVARGVSDTLTAATRDFGSAMWPTATTSDGDAGARPADPKRGPAPGLVAAAGMWPTATTMDAQSSGSRSLPGSAAHAGTSLTDAAVREQLWQTPATDSFRSRSGDRKDEMGLDQQARYWPTLRTITGGAESGERKKELGRTESGGGDLQAAANQWPTPSAGNFNDGESLESFDARKARQKARGINGNGMGDTLAIAAARTAEQWPTPAARDYKGSNSADHVTTNGTGRMHMDQLPNFVEHGFLSSPPVQEIPDGPQSLPPRPISPQPSEISKSGTLLAEISVYRRWGKRSGGAAGWHGTWTRKPRRSLNPRFVEWLMGWPTGLSGFGHAETGFSHWLQRMRGSLLKLCSKPEPRQRSLF